MIGSLPLASAAGISIDHSCPTRRKCRPIDKVAKLSRRSGTSVTVASITQFRYVTAEARVESARSCASAACQTGWSNAGQSPTGRQRRDGSINRPMCWSLRAPWHERRRADADALDRFLRLSDQVLLGRRGIVGTNNLVALIAQQGSSHLEAVVVFADLRRRRQAAEQ